MSDRIDTAKQLYAEFNKQNIPGILELLSPDIIWNSVSSTFASSPGGIVAMAVADCASPPIAKMSPSAWLAAICPNR